MHQFSNWVNDRNSYDELDCFLDEFCKDKSAAEILRQVVHELFNISCAVGEALKEIDKLKATKPKKGEQNVNGRVQEMEDKSQQSKPIRGRRQ